jgi:transposase-like protein
MATVEVITSVERRRRWSREAKVRIVAESARPDCTVSQVARAHDIAPGQLFTWRRELLAAAIESHGSEGDRGDSGLCRIEPHRVLSPRGRQPAGFDPWQRRKRVRRNANGVTVNSFCN